MPELTIIFLKSKPGLILLKTRFSNCPVLAINLPFNKFQISTKKQRLLTLNKYKPVYINTKNTITFAVIIIK